MASFDVPFKTIQQEYPQKSRTHVHTGPYFEATTANRLLAPALSDICGRHLQASFLSGNHKSRQVDTSVPVFDLDTSCFIPLALRGIMQLLDTCNHSAFGGRFCSAFFYGPSSTCLSRVIKRHNCLPIDCSLLAGKSRKGPRNETRPNETSCLWLPQTNMEWATKEWQQRTTFQRIALKSWLVPSN